MKLTLLIGVSGCGKSTYAKKHFNKENQVIVSSDAIRGELLGNEADQTQNDKVFHFLYAKVVENLKDERDVIVDATNIHKKDRVRLISFVRKHVKDYKDKIEVNYAIIATEPEICFQRNASRARIVPEEVIKRQLASFEMPDFDEFDEYCDKLYYIYTHKVSKKYKLKNKKFLEDLKFNQQSKYHRYSAYDHSMQTGDKVNDITFNKLIVLGAYIHDSGKYLAQQYDEEGFCHYYGHDYVGSYLALFYAKANGLKDFELELSLLVKHHMHFKQCISEKSKERLVRKIGEPLFLGLTLISAADDLAH